MEFGRSKTFRKGGGMKRFRSFFSLGFFVAISLQGCCGIGSGPSVSQGQQWMSVIHKGDSADKAIAVLKSRGFEVVDGRLTPRQAQLEREHGSSLTDPRFHIIYGSRATDHCIFTMIDKYLTVTVQLDNDDLVESVTVRERGEGP